MRKSWWWHPTRWVSHDWRVTGLRCRDPFDLFHTLVLTLALACLFVVCFGFWAPRPCRQACCWWCAVFVSVCQALANWQAFNLRQEEVIPRKIDELEHAWAREGERERKRTHAQGNKSMCQKRLVRRASGCVVIVFAIDPERDPFIGGSACNRCPPLVASTCPPQSK